MQLTTYHVFNLSVLLSKDANGPGILKAFSIPAHSLARTIVQTAGDLGYEPLSQSASDNECLNAYSFTILLRKCHHRTFDFV